jgi:hypothetical protein
VIVPPPPPKTLMWPAPRSFLVDAAVVAEVDDLGALGLDQPAHDVDRGVVAVEQAGGGDESQRRGVVAGGGDVGCWRAHARSVRGGSDDYVF